MNYASLHNHTTFSCLDGIAKIPDFVTRAKEFGYQALAITDHGTMAGVVRHYQECVKQGIKPILGVEAYFADDATDHDAQTFHLTLLAKNQIGYRNLCRLMHWANAEGFYRKPRIDWQRLKEWGDGVITLSGCLGSSLSKAVLARQSDQKLMNLANRFRDSTEHFFFEVMNSDLEDQILVRDAFVRLSRQMGVPCVATCDTHYIEPSHWTAQATARAIGFGKTLKDDVWYETNEYYVKNEKELRLAFQQQHLENTMQVADLVDLELNLCGVHLPIFDNDFGMTSPEMLKALIEIGWEKRGIVQLSNWKEYKERIAKEMRDVDALRLHDYFLIVWDIVRFCDEHGITYGDGRGSAAGSLILYLLGVTNIDPIEWGLYWERFYNAGRGELKIVNGEPFIEGSMPDVDLDVSFQNRDRVLAYLSEKWTDVAKLCAFSTLSAKQVIRDVGKAFCMSEMQTSKLTDLVPQQAYKVSLSEFIATNEHVRGLARSKDKTPCGKMWSEFFDVCHVLEGCYRHSSMHASAVIVSDRLLRESVPMMKAPASDEIIVGLEMDDAQAAGLMKVDCLGLRTLDAVAQTLEHVDEEPFDMSDRATWDMLGKGDTALVFQLDSTLGSDVSRLIKPRNLSELSDCVALQRPGPNNLVPEYCRCKKGGTSATGFDDLDAILKPTYGQLIYQEQVIQIASLLAGYDLKEADELRSILGKKKREKIHGQRRKFVSQFRHGEESGQQIFDQIERFADYSFNRCLKWDSIITDATSGNVYTIEQLSRKIPDGFTVHSFDEKTKRLTTSQPSRVFKNGKQRVFSVALYGNKKIKATENHRFLTWLGWRTVKELKQGDLVACACPMYSTIMWNRVERVKRGGESQTYDLEIPGNHNYVANGIVVHNSHSLAYATLTWKTAWLKCHYPLPFYVANLLLTRFEAKPQQEISKILVDAKAHGIRVVPPSIKSGQLEFAVEGDHILYGLRHIRHVGEKSLDSILPFSQRPDQNTTQALKFCLGLKKNVAENLIRCGAFDCVLDDNCQTRLELFFTFKILLSLTKKERDAILNFDRINMDILSEPGEYVSSKTIKRREGMLRTRIDQITKEWLASQNQENRVLCTWEIEALGFSLSSSLSEAYCSTLDSMPTIQVKDFPAQVEGASLSVVGQVTHLRKCLTKKEEPMAFGTLQDLGFQMRVVFFPRTWEEGQFFVNQDSVLFIDGTKRSDTLIANHVVAL